MSSIINDPGVISSMSDTTKIFAIKFASKSMLNNKGHPLPDTFPQNTHFTMFLSWLRKVFKCKKSLDSTKITDPDRIPVVVLKKLSLELSSVMAELFNYYQKGKCYSGL